MNDVSFIIKSHLREDSDPLIGGASKNPYRLLKYIARSVKVGRVIYFDGDHSGREPYQARACRVRFLKLYPRTLAQNIVSLPTVWRAFRTSAAIQCHHPHFGLGAAILRRLFFRRVRFIVKAHGTALPELRANQYKGLKGFILAFNARLHLHHDRAVLACADWVLCSSVFQLREMTSLYGIPVEKLRCIYNGFDPDYLPDKKSDVTQVPTAAQRFVFCGRVVPKKGIDYAISLFQRVAGEHADRELRLILGKRGEVEDPVLYRRIQALCANDPRIHVLHDLDEATLYRELSRSTAGLITSREYESLPTIVVEMLALGIPAFASYSWGIPEVLPETLGLSGNLESDSRRINDFLSTSNHSSRLAASHACARIRSKFDYPSLVTQYTELYTRSPHRPQ